VNALEHLSIPVRAGLVALLAIGVYLNSVPNGFAYDDPSIVPQNRVVTDGGLGDAFSESYWPGSREGTGLYRPVTIASFQLDWRLWNGHPAGFHAVNVLLHAGVSVLVLLLLGALTGPLPATLGAAVFAAHPVHVEAVANVVGRSELLAALGVLGACLLFLSDRGGTRSRGLRWALIGVLYAAALGAQEVAVSLPGLPAVLACAAEGVRGGLRRSLREWPLFLVLTAVLSTYLAVRGSVLGSVVGELPAPYLSVLDDGGRLLTAISVWPEYLRLMVFPLDLVSDYAPAVILPAHSFDRDVLLGLLVGLGVLWVSVRAWPRARLLSVGLGWFILAVLPVSNLLFAIGVMLAERTLYLPSVGVAFGVAGLVALAVEHGGGARRWAPAGVTLVVLLFGLRAAVRNPVWNDTFTMLQTLADEHPESYLALRARAVGLEEQGFVEEAERMYGLALELAPRDYSLLIEVGRFHRSHGNEARSLELLARASEVFPLHPSSWQERAARLLRMNLGREAHRTALEGLRRVGSDRELWALVAESYVLRSDFGGAARALRASIGAEEERPEEWRRLAQILEWDGRDEAAARARERADELAAGSRAGGLGG